MQGSSASVSTSGTQRVPELEWPGQCVLGRDVNTGRLFLFAAQSVEELCVWKRSSEKENRNEQAFPVGLYSLGVWASPSAAQRPQCPSL